MAVDAAVSVVRGRRAVATASLESISLLLLRAVELGSAQENESVTSQRSLKTIWHQKVFSDTHIAVKVWCNLVQSFYAVFRIHHTPLQDVIILRSFRFREHSICYDSRCAFICGSFVGECKL